MDYQQFRPSRFNVLPPVIKNLLIINGLFFIATIVFDHRFGIDLADILGLHYFGSEKFHPYQLITYMFMHGDFFHIFFNMFALWMFGNVLENVWGPKRFFIYYFVTGIGAVIIHYTIVYFQIKPVIDNINQFLTTPNIEILEGFVNSKKFNISSYEMLENFNHFKDKYNLLLSEGNKDQATYIAIEYFNQYKIDFLNAPNVVGASGAVFGILLAFGMLFPNTELFLMFFPIPIKAKYAVIIYGAFELIFGVLNISGDNIAHFAHLGGMLFGFILIKYWNRNINRFY